MQFLSITVNYVQLPDGVKTIPPAPESLPHSQDTDVTSSDSCTQNGDIKDSEREYTIVSSSTADSQQKSDSSQNPISSGTLTLTLRTRHKRRKKKAKKSKQMVIPRIKIKPIPPPPAQEAGIVLLSCLVCCAICTNIE